jgi:hypothetical protein
LSWWRSLTSCFLANRLISVITFSILTSLWRSAFLMYQAAWTMFSSTLILNFCITAVLLGFVYFWHYHAQANFLCIYGAPNRHVIKINWKL